MTSPFINTIITLSNVLSLTLPLHSWKTCRQGRVRVCGNKGSRPPPNPRQRFACNGVMIVVISETRKKKENLKARR
jgi:hypothetical protein